MFKKDSQGRLVYLPILAKKFAIAPRSGMTQSGYGNNLPSSTMVQTESGGVWRRVYFACFSNAGSAYVRVKGERVFIVNEGV